MAEIDESELASLRSVSSLFGGILKNKDARKLLLSARKIVEPEAVIPELDAAEPVLAEVKKIADSVSELRKSFDEKEAERTREANEAKISAQWNKGQSLALKSGYIGDSLKALEDFMKEKGIFDHEIAIPAFERLHPQQQPVTPTGNRFDFQKVRGSRDDDANMKRLFAGDDEGFLDSAISDTLKDLRGQLN